MAINREFFAFSGDNREAGPSFLLEVGNSSRFSKELRGRNGLSCFSAKQGVECAEQGAGFGRNRVADVQNRGKVAEAVSIGSRNFRSLYFRNGPNILSWLCQSRGISAANNLASERSAG